MNSRKGDYGNSSMKRLHNSVNSVLALYANKDRSHHVKSEKTIITTSDTNRTNKSKSGRRLQINILRRYGGSQSRSAGNSPTNSNNGNRRHTSRRSSNERRHRRISDYLTSNANGGVHDTRTINRNLWNPNGNRSRSYKGRYLRAMERAITTFPRTRGPTRTMMGGHRRRNGGATRNGSGKDVTTDRYKGRVSTKRRTTKVRRARSATSSRRRGQ